MNKFSSDSLQIWYIDSSYQYDGVYKLIYFIIFSLFVFYHCFYLEKMAWENVKVSE